MIERLTGTLVEAGAERVMIDVGGVGYAVSVPTGTHSRLPAPGGTAELRIRAVLQRGEAIVLYGFASRDEAELFDLLRAVSGVGPGLAVKLLSISVEQLRSAIRSRNVKMLQAAPGVGAKLARRLITELADALPDEDGGGGEAAAGPDPMQADLVSALVNLQFSDARRVASVVEEVVRDLPDGDFPTRFRAALGALAPGGRR